MFLLRFAFFYYEHAVDASDDALLDSFVLLDESQERLQPLVPLCDVEAPPAAVPGLFFDTFSVSQVDVEIDFKAKGRRVDEALLQMPSRPDSGARVAAIYQALYVLTGMLSVNESHATLATVLLRRVSAAQLTAQLQAHWFPQLQRDNVTSLLAGFEPVKFVFRIGDASVALVRAPLAEYHRGGGNVLGEFALSGKNLGRTIYVETFRGLSNLLLGTSNMVRQVSKVLCGLSSVVYCDHGVLATHVCCSWPRAHTGVQPLRDPHMLVPSRPATWAVVYSSQGRPSPAALAKRSKGFS